ncbi:MAG: FtsX-like permease family protein [Acidimicrobiia bacterium]
MRAVGAVAYALLRRAPAGFVVLGVVAGLGLGFSVTALAGARRSDTAYARLEQATLAPDAVFDATDLDARAIARLNALDGVRAATRFTYTPVAPAGLRTEGGALVGLDAAFLTRVYRPLVVRGRLSRPGAVDEVVVNEVMARRAHLHPGQRVGLRSGFDRKASLGTVRVVGVVRGTFDVGPNAGNASMLLSRAFLREHRRQMVLGPQPATLVRLAPGHAVLARVRRALRASAGHDVVVVSADGDARSVERALSVQTVGLTVLGFVALFATLAAVAQALSRLFDRALADLSILEAVGLQPRQRLLIGAALAAPVALLGSAVAALASTLASPLIPTGFARAVDPATGVHVDLTVLAGGAVVGIAVVLGAGVLLAWRHRARRPGDVRVGRETRLVRHLPVRARLGCQAALAPRSAPAGAASRSALIASTLGIAAVVAVGTFGASLTDLLHDRALYGWTFDVAIAGSEGGSQALRTMLAGISDVPAVRRIGYLSVVEVSLDGRRMEAYAFDRDGLALHPSMRSGRAPAADDEVAIGADGLDRLGLGIGDTVVAAGRRGRVRLHVVGSATYPELGNNSDLSQGVSLTHRIATRIGATEHAGVALVRLDDGAHVRALAKYRDAGELVAPFRPPRVRNLERVGGLPGVLAAFVAMLGLLAVGHGLWRSIRVRRRDFAVLETIGYRPRDLRAIVLWQAGSIAVISLALGIPVGLLVGRAAWSAVADATGVVNRLVVPSLTIVLVTVGALATVNLVGLAAARWATHTRPTTALRDQ